MSGRTGIASLQNLRISRARSALAAARTHGRQRRRVRPSETTVPRLRSASPTPPTEAHPRRSGIPRLDEERRCGRCSRKAELTLDRAWYERAVFPSRPTTWQSGAGSCILCPPCSASGLAVTSRALAALASARDLSAKRQIRPDGHRRNRLHAWRKPARASVSFSSASRKR
jgi:hypothetical protein